jgi:hypothetical protein
MSVFMKVIMARLPMKKGQGGGGGVLTDLSTIEVDTEFVKRIFHRFFFAFFSASDTAARTCGEVFASLVMSSFASF